MLQFLFNKNFRVNHVKKLKIQTIYGIKLKKIKKKYEKDYDKA